MSAIVVNTVSTIVIGEVTVTGSTTVVGTVTVTGSTTIVGSVTVTGSTTIVGTVTVTGSTAIVGSVTVTGTTTTFNLADMGRTIVSTSGTLSATNGTLVVSSSSQKIKVYAYSITTTSSTQQLCQFTSGVGGAALWAVALIAPTGAVAGANLAIQPPGYIFAVPSSSVLNLSLTGTNAVHWSISYFLEA